MVSSDSGVQPLPPAPPPHNRPLRDLLFSKWLYCSLLSEAFDHKLFFEKKKIGKKGFVFFEDLLRSRVS